MKRALFVFVLMLSSVAAFSATEPLPFSGDDTTEVSSKWSPGIGMLSRIASAYTVPEIEYEPKPPVKYWQKGLLAQLNFSQMSLTNWAEGGDGSIAMSAYLDFKANYAKGYIFWDNRLQLGYGFVQNFGDIYKKADDKIVFDSKWGYKAIEKLFVSAIFNFRTQFSPGFKYPEAKGDPYILESVFMAPGYVTLGIGADYKPFDWISVNFAPLTGNLIVVENPLLREKYGNKPDEAARLELGAQLKVDVAHTFAERVRIQTAVTLFSNFLDSPQNIKVNWDLTADIKVTKFISVNLRTNLIYDDKILIADKDGHKAPRIQFKEALSVGLAYTFGGY